MSAALKETMLLLKGAKNKYARGSGKTVKFKEGKTKVRLLRFSTPEDPRFWRDLGVHWIKPDNDDKTKPLAVVGCHDVVFDKPCPVCALIEKAIKSATDDEELQIYMSWKARKEVLVNALVLDGPDASPDPQIVSMTPTTFGSFNAVMMTYVEADIDPLDLVTGIDFFVERRGKGFDTKYQVMAAPVSKPISPEVLKKIVDIDAFIEKEFFRGEETKALSHIENISGVSSTLHLPRRAVSAALLTAPLTSASPPESLSKVADERESRAAEAAKLRAEADARAAASAKVETVAKVEEAAVSPKADAFNSDLAVEELDSILAGLDDL